ncbi:hypothetical protein [Nocardioides jejuensis]|uniref:Uncharacterized protein n=1 Tax=Nocardioides jejuensis TaxID=2502782 RepID=A0A4R1CJH3_9ACTN|nr:hypothetical protein [Nocardioides jejuensis]TCJ30505.1 hypothetical protein EPD65_02730 [Nocardioides jejuensis]
MSAMPERPTPQQYVARLVVEAGARTAGHDAPAVGAQAVERLLALVEAASVPGRGTEYSAPLRLASGLLADLLLQRDPGPGEHRPVTWPRFRRKGVLVLGPHGAVRATRLANGLVGEEPPRPDQVVVLGLPLDEALADVWSGHVWQGENRTWGGMVSSLAARDRIPPRADAASIAARWSRIVGKDRVHLVTRPGTTPGITRAPFRVVHPPVTAAAIELVRATSSTLGILTDSATQTRVLEGVLRPLLEGDAGPRPRVQPELVPWLERRAAGVARRAAAGGYALHGDPADLAPGGTGSVTWPGSADAQAATLAVAVRTLLAICEETP